VEVDSSSLGLTGLSRSFHDIFPLLLLIFKLDRGKPCPPNTFIQSKDATRNVTESLSL